MPQQRIGLRQRRAVSRIAATRPPYQRVLWALQRLRRGDRVRATDLAGQFEISPRTAYRDLDFARDRLQAPIEYDRQRGSYVLTEPTYDLPAITMTRGELLAIFFAQLAASQYRGTPYESELRAALDKLREALADEVRVAPNALADFLSLDLGPVTTPDPEVFTRVAESYARRRCLRVRYTSFGSGRTLDRTVEPYRVFNKRGDWYLAAHDHRRRAVRHFALQRIRRAEVTDVPYAIKPGFRFEAHLADAFSVEKGAKPVAVAIRFLPRQAQYIRERRWHATQKIQDRLDGGCVLRMRVSGLDEVRRWVLGFGAEAEVLTPTALRRAVTEELRAAGRLYRPPGRRSR
jgi:predicted DNA-binding transcriptional regulator YafY